MINTSAGYRPEQPFTPSTEYSADVQPDRAPIAYGNSNFAVPSTAHLAEMARQAAGAQAVDHARRPETSLEQQLEGVVQRGRNLVEVRSRYTQAA